MSVTDSKTKPDSPIATAPCQGEASTHFAQRALAAGGQRVVFENDSFVAVDKPGGWLAVPGRIGAADARPVVGLVLEMTRSGRILPVHRLDAEVSGLILYAKTSQAHRAANAWFEGRLVSKVYEAWSEGTAPVEGSLAQTWTSRLARGKKRAFEAAHGKPAETRALWLGSRQVQSREPGADPHTIELQCWQLEPHTGRAHQLRYELAKRGCPIAGDTLYGATRVITGLEGIALRSITLNFTACPDAPKFGLPPTLHVAGLSLPS